MVKPHRAELHLRSADAKLAVLMDWVGPYRFRRRRDGTHFDSVFRSILYQQLSGKAAGTIYARVQAHFGGRPPTAAELLRTPDEPLRGAGVSRQKLGYLRGLASKAASGEVPFERLESLDDAAVIDALTCVKGVGLWTAQMFLIFRLGRPDVLPDTDLGIQKAVQRAYGMRSLPSPKRVQKVGAAWRPYCSAASWYLWRSLDDGFWA